MTTYVMALDSTAVMPSDCYYILYKGLYMKYIKLMIPGTNKPLLQHTDSLLAITERGEQDVWLKMSEFARAWAYANDLKIRVTPWDIFSGLGVTEIKKANNTYGEFRTLTQCKGFIKGSEFIRIAYIDTKEKAELLRLFTTADANPNVYFKILFFWHTLVYPEKCANKGDKEAQEYINEKFPLLEEIQRYKDILFDETFGKIKDNNIGYYIYSNIRHAIAHIQRNSGISLKLENLQQLRHLDAVARILRSISEYKLNNDYSFNTIAPYKICHLYDPDKEFSQNS